MYVQAVLIFLRLFLFFFILGCESLPLFRKRNVFNFWKSKGVVTWVRKVVALQAMISQTSKNEKKLWITSLIGLTVT